MTIMIGDRVKVNTPGEQDFNGKIGTVVAKYSDQQYWVALSGWVGSPCLFNSLELTHIETYRVVLSFRTYNFYSQELTDLDEAMNVVRLTMLYERTGGPRATAIEKKTDTGWVVV